LEAQARFWRSPLLFGGTCRTMIFSADEQAPAVLSAQEVNRLRWRFSRGLLRNMEHLYRLLAFNNGPAYDRLKAILDRLGARYTIKRLGASPAGEMVSLEYISTESDPLFRDIERLVATKQFYVQTGVRFSEQERKSADWLYARVSESQYPQPEDDLGYRQVTYDLGTFCWRCGIGANQVRPFRLARDFQLRRSHFMGLHWSTMRYSSGRSQDRFSRKKASAGLLIAIPYTTGPVGKYQILFS